MERYCNWKKGNGLTESNEPFKRGWVCEQKERLNFNKTSKTFDIFECFFCC